MFLFGGGNATPRVFVYSLNNAHFKAMQHFTGILENTMRRRITDFDTELVIIQQSADGDELISATQALGLAHLLNVFKKHRTIQAVEDTGIVVLAFELGRAQTFVTAEDVVVVMHESATANRCLAFLTKQTVCSRKVHLINVLDYLETPKGGDSAAPQQGIKQIMLTR